MCVYNILYIYTNIRTKQITHGVSISKPYIFILIPRESGAS